MKTNKILMVSAVASVLMTMSSCGEDFLDRSPLHGYTAPTYYTSDEAVIKATEPLYNYAWHGAAPKEEDYKIAMEDLKEVR